MPKKRFSAFDDFPTEPSSRPDWKTEPSQNSQEGGPAAEISATAASRTAEPSPQPLFDGIGSGREGGLDHASVLGLPEAAQVERIERLKPSQMMPDRFQPRRLLPTVLRTPYYTRKISCYQAAHQWLQLAKNDNGLQGEVDRLLKMGFSFEEHGQIKPITGSWVETRGGDYFFQIETGERRFWAACLQYAAQDLKEEPLLRVEVVSSPTRMRQVLENRHAEPPSAVGQACEVASLILAELDVVPQAETVDEFEFFRQARAQRMPPGLWEKIMPVMDLTRPRLVQLLNILSLPTPLLDLADRYRVPERVLREVLAGPREKWEPLLVASIHNSLTSDDIAVLANKPGAQERSEKRKSAPPDPASQAINAMKRFLTALNTLDEDTQSAVLDELANDLVLSEQGQETITKLHDLSERVRIRQQNRYRRR